MGRRMTPVSFAKLQQILDEQSNFVGKQLDFFNNCVEIYNKNSENKITTSVLMLRLKEGKITTTFKSQRGKELTQEHKDKLVAGRTGGRKSKKCTSAKHSEEMRKYFPEKINAVERVLSGSLSAAVKLKCYECCCGDRASVRECTCYTCPLWNFRPYQKEIE